MANIIVTCYNSACKKSFAREAGEVVRSNRLGIRSFCCSACQYAVNQIWKHEKSEAQKQLAATRIKGQAGNRRDDLTPFRYFYHLLFNNVRRKACHLSLQDLKKRCLSWRDFDAWQIQIDRQRPEIEFLLLGNSVDLMSLRLAQPDERTMQNLNSDELREYVDAWDFAEIMKCPECNKWTPICSSCIFYNCRSCYSAGTRLERDRKEDSVTLCQMWAKATNLTQYQFST